VLASWGKSFASHSYDQIMQASNVGVAMWRQWSKLLFDMPGFFDALKTSPCLQDPRVRIETGSIEDPATLARLVDTPGMTVFHLAGIMSGQGEKDFDLCMRVNLDGCRNVLEACRARQAEDSRLVRVVFASSCATFGETTDLPVKDHTKQVPLNTYGVTKTVGELLVNDYTRKGFVDGCSARLPTVIVRPGAPNAASTSCFSGVAREPLKGVDVALPVGRHLPHAVTSTRAIIANLKALHDADMGAVGQAPIDRAVSLPSISVTLQVIIDALHRVVPENQRSKLGKITDAVDPFLSGVVESMAMKSVNSSKALALGLQEVPDVDTIIREYIEDFSSDCVVSLTPATVTMQGLQVYNPTQTDSAPQDDVVNDAAPELAEEKATTPRPWIQKRMRQSRSRSKRRDAVERSATAS